jgi:hypothetical protein
VSEMDRGKVGAATKRRKSGRRCRGKVGAVRSECWGGAASDRECRRAGGEI